MNEKKTLNFDFLDENSKATDEKISTPVSTPGPVPKGDKINFFEYFKNCYTNFSKFAQEYLVTEKPKYLILVIWVLGIGNVANNLTISDSSTWGEVWTTAIFGGILTGVVNYYIAGWFYHLRVGWSKGVGTIDTSRNIYIFSSLPVAVTGIGLLLFNHMVYGNDYFDLYYLDSSSVDIIFGLLALAAFAYSIYISYQAVRNVMHVQKKRGMFWFVIAPTIFYMFILGVVLF